MKAVFVTPVVLLSIFTVFCNYEFYFPKTKRIMFASTIAAIINIILNWIFISLFGYLSAVYTTLMSHPILFVFHYKSAEKISRENFDERAFKPSIILTIVILTCVG